MLLCYPNCSTCKKSPGLAGKQRLPRIPQHQNRPTHRGGAPPLAGPERLPLKRFFNTSGLSYKSLQLKDKLPKMSEGQQFAPALHRRHAG